MAKKTFSRMSDTLRTRNNFEHSFHTEYFVFLKRRKFGGVLLGVVKIVVVNLTLM